MTFLKNVTLHVRLRLTRSLQIGPAALNRDDFLVSLYQLKFYVRFTCIFLILDEGVFATV